MLCVVLLTPLRFRHFLVVVQRERNVVYIKKRYPFVCAGYVTANTKNYLPDPHICGLCGCLTPTLADPLLCGLKNVGEHAPLPIATKNSATNV